MAARILDVIKRSILEMDVSRVAPLVKQALEDGLPPLKVLDVMVGAMKVVGKRFEEKEYFLADLIMAGEAFNMGLKILQPLLQSAKQARSMGSVVIGTVKGDIHDIGKNIVSTMLTSAGFQVHDIGVDTPPESFVDKIKETDAKILALSALLTTATGSIAEVINLMTEVGIRSRVKVIAGGAAVTKELAKQLGADAYAEDAVEAVKVCRKLLREAV